MASGLAEILGDKLLGKTGEVATQSALEGKKAVALYFSAHWCPPCRAFTPKFAEWYTADLQKKGLEVVFVSSDSDTESFNDYYKEQPWLAIPYEDDEKKEALNKKFKVSGIPAVVILGPDGELISKDGRSDISNDPTGENMPWRPPVFSDVFADAKLISSDGSEKKGSDLRGSVFALYFSAHWCPPCRGFTPQLAEWYKKDLKAKRLEVVFVSSDRDEAGFKEYFAEQPWLALDFSDRKRKEQLSQCFGVNGIPSLAIVDKDGSIINKDGRAAVSADPTGAEFPWHPKPVANLKGGPGNINEVTTILAFCETSDAAAKSAAEAAMEPLAKKYLADAKAAGEDDPKLAFMIVTDNEGLAPRIRSMLQLPDANGKPKLMIVDIPDNGGFYEGPEGDITADSVQKFVDEYLAKSLKRLQLSRL